MSNRDLIKEQNQAYAEALAVDRAKDLEEQQKQRSSSATNRTNPILVPDDLAEEDDENDDFAPVDHMDEEAQLAAALEQSKSEARLNGTLLPRDDPSFQRSWEQRWTEMRSTPLQQK